MTKTRERGEGKFMKLKITQVRLEARLWDRGPISNSHQDPK